MARELENTLITAAVTAMLVFLSWLGYSMVQVLQVHERIETVLSSQAQQTDKELRDLGKRIKTSERKMDIVIEALGKSDRGRRAHGG